MILIFVNTLDLKNKILKRLIYDINLRDHIQSEQERILRKRHKKE